MSARIRGQEAFVSLTVAGQPLSGSFAKVKDFTATARTDLTEESYLGETFDDIDIQHHGWDFSFTVDEIDDSSINYIQQLMENEENTVAPAEVVMTVQLTYRTGVLAAPKLLTFSEVVMKANELSFPSRKDYISTSFEGKAKRLTIK